MFRWLIGIRGSENILRDYSTFLSDDQVSIVEELDWNDHSHYYLTSVCFNNLTSEQDVKDKSRIVMNLFVGAVSLANGDMFYFDLLDDRILKINLEDYYIDPQLRNLRLESSSNQLIKKAIEDVDIRNILNIIGESCQLRKGDISYDRLYFIYEILEKRWGTEQLQEIAKQRFWKDFKHTAQDPRILGIEARHGSFSNKSILNPIKKEDVINKIMLAFKAWVNDDFKIVLGSYNSFPYRRNFSVDYCSLRRRIF